MQRDTRNTVIAVGVIVIVIVGAYVSLVAYTGLTMPFSSVVSESMQHDNTRSEIGIIDTGDVVVVMDPDKAEIQSYVEGVASGYQTFGDYGSVIIYNRDNQNPVIHRAILWLEYNSETDTWSAPSLADTTVEWYCTGSSDWSNLSGILVLHIGDKTPNINLDTLAKSSGYLTMGDNPVTNTNFDQASGIASHLVAYEDIKSVPVFEIPWIGTLKLLISGSSSLDKVPNSLPSLVMVIIIIFSIFLLLDMWTVLRYKRQVDETMESISRWSRRPTHPSVSTGTPEGGMGSAESLPEEGGESQPRE